MSEPNFSVVYKETDSHPEELEQRVADKKYAIVQQRLDSYEKMSAQEQLCNFLYHDGVLRGINPNNLEDIPWKRNALEKIMGLSCTPSSTEEGKKTIALAYKKSYYNAPDFKKSLKKKS